METRKSFGFFLFTIFSFSLLLTACGGSDPADAVLPSSQATCGGQAIPNSYLIQWRNGNVTKVNYDDVDALKDEVVRPNLGDIQRIEYDQKFEVRAFHPRVIFNGGGIDNWGYRSVHAEVAWSKGNYGQNVTVAVIDSGVDITHPLLADHIAVNAGEVAGNGIDDDHNGYVDDVTGYNFLYGNGDVTDDVSHGTHVSGIVAGKHSETFVSDDMTLGMAPQAKILPLKFIGPQGGTLSGALEAMDYARQRGVRIINASWGGDACSKILSDKVAELGRAGVLFVTAAGNSGHNLENFPEYPAAFLNPLQLTIGSVSTYGGMSDFSNYSRRYVHLFAPGYEITSSLPGGQIGAMSGTSMATPFVAGAAALLLSKDPHMNVQKLHDLVEKATVQDSNYLNITHGVLNLQKVSAAL